MIASPSSVVHCLLNVLPLWNHGYCFVAFSHKPLSISVWIRFFSLQTRNIRGCILLSIPAGFWKETRRHLIGKRNIRHKFLRIVISTLYLDTQALLAAMEETCGPNLLFGCFVCLQLSYNNSLCFDFFLNACTVCCAVGHGWWKCKIWE